MPVDENRPSRSASPPSQRLALFGRPVLGGLAVIATAALLAPSGMAAGQVRSASRHPIVASMIQVRKIKIGGSPAQFATDDRMRAVWVAAFTRLVRISEATQKVTAKLKIRANDVAVDPKTATVWATDVAGSTLIEISEKTHRVIHRYTHLPGSPQFGGVATDARTGMAYVSTVGTLDEISEARHRVVRVISLRAGPDHGGAGVAVDPVRNMIWVNILPDDVGASAGWISQINGSTGRLIRNYHGFPESVFECCVVLAVDPIHGQVWAGDQGHASIISEARHRVVRDLRITPNEFWSAITIDPRHKIVLIADANNLLTVSQTSGKILRTVRLFKEPSADAISDVKVDLDSGTVYAALLMEGAVAVLKE
jgi:DNA-binding beta-propeller fold protein YncE